MPRPSRDNTDAPGHDSFLDIVANMVGILIILVMVVGVRVKNAPVVAAIAGKKEPLAAELEKDLAEEQALQAEARRVASEIDETAKEALVHGQQRDLLAVVVASLQQKIETGRRQMDADAQAAFDLQRSLAESRAHLDQLIRQRLQTEMTPSETTVVESYPTPMSRTVNGREAHFQLRGGLITSVPVNELLDELKRIFRQRSQRLLSQRELTETLGPRQGFRLRYMLARHDISPEMAMQLGRGGTVVRLELAEFIPISDRMGEPIEAALAEGSEFRRTLATILPGRTAITVWTYADSFGSFRRLKKELYRMGYSVAARPLPLGVPISASPDGTKSAAE